MKSLTLLTILILLLGTGYIGFSILTFEPDTPQRYDLSIQTPETLEDKSQQVLSVQAEQRKANIISSLKRGITLYDNGWMNAPVQAQTMKETLEAAIKISRIPVYYPVSNFSGISAPNFPSYNVLEPVSMLVSQVQEGAEEGTISSASCANADHGFILGDTGDNALSCNLATDDKTRVFLAGPGNDSISVRGNAIINSGTGNDEIISGPEFTMIYVEPNFGTDSINMDCSKAEIQPLNTPTSKTLPWSEPFSHYIVFDPRLSKKDITITGNTLKHNNTGDEITLSANCFNIIFTATE